MTKKRVDPAHEPLLREMLKEMSEVRECNETCVRRRVALLRNYGVSWEDIAGALGIHRRTAQRQFSEPD